MKRISEFDYVVPNPDGSLEQTVDTVMSIVVAEKHRAIPHKASL
jgi:hypothetical protein